MYDYKTKNENLFHAEGDGPDPHDIGIKSMVTPGLIDLHMGATMLRAMLTVREGLLVYRDQEF